VPAKAPRIAFSHIGIFATDLAKMEDFYTRVLGMVVTDRGPLETARGAAQLVFLSRNPREHHQLVLVSGRPANIPFNVVNQISFRVGSLAELRALYRKVTDARYAEIAPVSHGNALSVYFRDPEGNRIELFIDTPWYVKQPLRLPLDFSRPDDELMRWAENLARRQPGFRPVAAWRREMAQRMGRAGTSSRRTTERSGAKRASSAGARRARG
jgi:catechol 2,3-dioxygenase-like lactoylglutathione lyase family enzyme